MLRNARFLYRRGCFKVQALEYKYRLHFESLKYRKACRAGLGIAVASNNHKVPSLTVTIIPNATQIPDCLLRLRVPSVVCGTRLDVPLSSLHL